MKNEKVIRRNQSAKTGYWAALKAFGEFVVALWAKKKPDNDESWTFLRRIRLPRSISLLIVPIIIVVLDSCSGSTQVKIVINNQTPDILDSIFVTPNTVTKYGNLLPEGIGTFNADLKGIRGDGHFSIHYKAFGFKRRNTIDLGYYSNGRPTEKQYFVEIWRDTVIIKNNLEAF